MKTSRTGIKDPTPKNHCNNQPVAVNQTSAAPESLESNTQQVQLEEAIASLTPIGDQNKVVWTETQKVNNRAKLTSSGTTTTAESGVTGDNSGKSLVKGNSYLHLNLQPQYATNVLKNHLNIDLDPHHLDHKEPKIYIPLAQKNTNPLQDTSEYDFDSDFSRPASETYS